MSLRKTIFWLHLASGLLAGAVIGIMSFTGAALAFEKEIVAWSEREARLIAPPASAAVRLPIDELVSRARAVHPDSAPTSVIVRDDPLAAIAVAFGRTSTAYVNPYTGEVRTPEPNGWRTFMTTMVQWHRYLAMSGDQRATGKAITGVSNAAFVVLGLTGLYLWWPRAWTKRLVSRVTRFDFQLRGKARDWNWHNVIGFWCLLPILILALTALPISYQWAGNLINTLNGPEAAGTAPLVVVPPAEGARPLGPQAWVEAAQTAVPAWKQITLNLGSPAGPRGGARGTTTASFDSPATKAPSLVTLSIRAHGTWPRTSTTTLSLDPFTASVLRHEGFADLPTGRQVRAWTRFLHTGEALGPAGQAVAGIACIGGVILVWTGFALSWRRFFGRKERGSVSDKPELSHSETAVR